MTRTLLTAIFLTLFSQTAWASDVYLCKKSGFNYTDLETMEVGQGIQFGVATEDQGIQEKPFIPTIAEYDFKLIEVRINKRQTIFLGNSQFLEDQSSYGPWYSEVSGDEKIYANKRLRFDHPKKSEDKIDMNLYTVVTTNDYVVVQKANCILMK